MWSKTSLHFPTTDLKEKLIALNPVSHLKVIVVKKNVHVRPNV